MSGRIRKSLDSYRDTLSKALDDVPQLRFEFESTVERDAHLRELRQTKEKLSMKFSRFNNLHQKLVEDDFGDVPAEEHTLIEEAIAANYVLISRHDDLLGDLVFAISDIERQQAGAEVPRPVSRHSLDSRAETPVQENSIVFARPPSQQSDNNRNVDAPVRPNDHMVPYFPNGNGNDNGPFRPPAVMTARLPKLQLVKFGGNIKMWGEFWDSFNSAVHSNNSLSQIDKMNYLRAQLFGEAKLAISGLTATADNYRNAITLLKNRYGNNQLIIDSHYAELSNLKPVSNVTSQLRALYDALEQHFLSLEALGECVEHRHFVSIVKQKLPSAVIMHLEERLEEGEELTLKFLRKRFGQYILSRERSESSAMSSRTTASKPDVGSRPYRTDNHPRVSTAGALLAPEKGKSYDVKCAFCGEKHFSDTCTVHRSYEERRSQLKNRCIGCLNLGHRLKECRSVKQCPYCKANRSHHRSLCAKKFSKKSLGGPTESVHVAAESSEWAHATDPGEGHQSTISTHVSLADNSLMAAGETVALQTASAKISPVRTRKSVHTRLLLDSGSQRTYISSSLASKLGLKPISKGKLSVFTFGCAKAREIDTVTVELEIRLIDGSCLKVTANVVPLITGSVRREPIDMKCFGPLVQQLPLADIPPVREENLSIDLLIGSDYYHDLVTAERLELKKGLYLIGSKLGWIISGRHASSGNRDTPISTFFVQTAFTNSYDNCHSLVSADASLTDKLDLQHFWNLETIGIQDKPVSGGDDEALKTFNESICFENGRYSVKWPWKPGDINLPTNYNLALGRLKSLLTQCQKRPGVFSQYQGILEEQLRQGMIEKVCESSSPQSQVHYIPHHAVITPHKESTKLRIVYDGSAKIRKGNLSLNDCLFRGPVFLEEVPELLMRFRLGKVALVADLEKAFLQIGLQEPDRDVTRFLWLKDPKRLCNRQDLNLAPCLMDCLLHAWRFAGALRAHQKVTCFIRLFQSILSPSARVVGPPPLLPLSLLSLYFL